MSKATKSPGYARLRDAADQGHYDSDRDPEKAWLWDACIELFLRVAHLEAKLERQEQTIAPKRKVGGLG